MNALVGVTGGHVLAALVLLALFVELALLYPSVRLQLKQKKIHLFHKKLVDRFRVGELSYSQTESELGKLYAVNEKIHSRGAVLVILQVLLFLAVLWGLNLLTQSPGLFHGAWTVLNFDLLQKATAPLLPVLVSLLYFLHALTKIVCKEKADYISPTQTMMALLFAVLGSTVIYFFAGTFAGALSVFCAAIFAFSTVRYLIVEGHAQTWGELAQHDLIEMLRHAETSHDRFETFSQAWNHLPVVRYINFHLLEEALSMSLGLMLALNFFGVFSNPDHDLSANVINVPYAMASFPTTTRSCDNAASNLPRCQIATLEDGPTIAGYAFGTQRTILSLNAWKKYTNFATIFGPNVVSFFGITYNNGLPLSDLPPSCCFVNGTNSYQAVKPSNTLSGGIISNFINEEVTVGCRNVSGTSCSGLTATQCTTANAPGCSYATGACTGTPTQAFIAGCDYQFENIPHVSIASGCPAAAIVGGDSVTLHADAAGGSRYFKWNVSDAVAGTAVSEQGNGTASHQDESFTFPTVGNYKIILSDYFNPLNSSDTVEGTSAATSCTVNVVDPPLVLPTVQSAIGLNGPAVTLAYTGGPSDRTGVNWELVSGAGTLDAATGSYTPSSTGDLHQTIVVKAHDVQFPDNVSAPLTLTYGAPSCNPQFGLYDRHDRPVALKDQTRDKKVYGPGTYRFFIKHAVVPGTYGHTPNPILDHLGLSSHATGLEPDGTPYIDLSFDSAVSGTDLSLLLWDSSVPEGDTSCLATVHLKPQGQGIRLNSLRQVHLGF